MPRGGATWAQPISEAADLTPFAAARGRIGAARALQIVDADGRTLGGNFSDPAWESRGGGLFFTRDFGGTRNIWRAFPDPRDASRYPRWRALPITQFAAPLFAFGARPLDGDRALLMISNAANPRIAAQATLFDLKNPSLRALTNENDGVLHLAPSPDGSAFAFASFSRRAASKARDGIFASVWLQNLGDKPAPAQQIAPNAWRPAWQKGDALLVEDVGNREISRLLLGNRGVPALKIAEGSSISATTDGATLILVGKSGVAAPLYLLAGDGSGLTALSSTEGAQAPALSGDGRWLTFTAPLGSANERGLWILPLQDAPAPQNAPGIDDLASAPGSAPAILPVIDAPPANAAPPVAEITPKTSAAPKTRFAAPVALIRAVQNAPRGAIAVWGTASGLNASATLEIGRGDRPRRWEAREIELPIAPDAPLLLWNPPSDVRGKWNFRLTVSGPGGAAQSLFVAQLPLAVNIPNPAPTVPAPVPTIPPPIKIAPDKIAPGKTSSMPLGGPLPVAPLPDLPAPPPNFPPPLPPLSPAPPVRDNPVRDNSAPPTFQLPVPPAPRRNPAPNPSDGGSDAASFNVSNTLAQMKAGQNVTVTFWALNKGMRAWETEANSSAVVRLVTRWIRFDNGNRNGWTYQTMKNPVLPGARAKWEFELAAPRQPGRYKLIYALQRVDQGWAPPAYNSLQEKWPGDFAVIAFAVVVKP